jgi:hypothetical protein
MRYRYASSLIAMAVALAAASCGRGRGQPPAPTPQPPAAVAYPAPSRIYYGNAGGIQDSMRLVVREEAEFRDLWQRATSRQSSPPAPPVIDFTRDMVVVVATGRMTPDDQIQVDSATISRAPDASGRMAETLNVVVRTTQGCRRSSVDAYPLEILRLRRFDAAVRFIDRREQAEGCRMPEPAAEPNR